MYIGEPLRTIIVEHLELPVHEPDIEPVPGPLEPEAAPEAVPSTT